MLWRPSSRHQMLVPRHVGRTNHCQKRPAQVRRTTHGCPARNGQGYKAEPDMSSPLSASVLRCCPMIHSRLRPTSAPVMGAANFILSTWRQGRSSLLSCRLLQGWEQGVAGALAGAAR